MMYLDEHYQTDTGLVVHRVGSEVTEPPGFTIDRPSGTDDFDFLYFSTPVELKVRGEHRQVRAGGCVLYGPGSPQWYTGGKRSFSHDWFHFYGPEADRLVARTGLSTDAVLYPQSAQFVTDIVRAVCLEIIQKQHCWDQVIASHVASLLVQLARNLAPVSASGETQCGRRTQKALVHHRIRDVRLALLGAPEQRWTVAEMAKRAFLSRARFSALYKECFGISPMEDVIQMRLQKARWLIENSTMSVKQIADRVGFEDAAYFNRLFRRRVGVSPGRYR